MIKASYDARSELHDAVVTDLFNRALIRVDRNRLRSEPSKHDPYVLFHQTTSWALLNVDRQRSSATIPRNGGLCIIVRQLSTKTHTDDFLASIPSSSSGVVV